MASSPKLQTTRPYSPTAIGADPASQRKPSLSIKPSPMASASPPAGSPGMVTSLLSREWVIPPRPKPGRKPATDTPPTKRKAQNRAAQRAFRERRAARVGELEEQMKQMEAEDEEEQTKLRDQIDKLEKEVEHYRDELVRSIERCRGLENELAAARRHEHSRTDTTDAVPLPRRTATKEDTSVGCGNCSTETNCQCLDEAFDVLSAAAQRSDPVTHDKRALSPGSHTRQKRVKTEPEEGQEIDFTAMFASHPRRDATGDEILSPHSATADPCGFCSDGTPCLCAQMAAEQHHDVAETSLQNVNASGGGPTVHHLSQFTPPPSEGDVSTLQTVTSNPCASGPGTCAQCRADPNSTLFCKSLAASRSQFPTNGATTQECCGAKGADASCCQGASRSSPRATRSKKASTNSNPVQAGNTKQSHITLSCADAYTTLSRHPGYERASGEIASWMPQLRATNVAPGNKVPLAGRPAMEIDAANVMTVLKEFDRRFGENP